MDTSAPKTFCHMPMRSHDHTSTYLCAGDRMSAHDSVGAPCTLLQKMHERTPCCGACTCLSSHGLALTMLSTLPQ
eukprot:11118308-Alexandrium_andersonii.AAC.1